MNILVTGANGQLGQCLQWIVNANKNGDKDHYVGERNYYIFKGREELDISDYEQVLKTVREEFINVIVNCAAYTNVNKAQEDKERAYLINAQGAINLAKAASTVGAVLIHISTDYVFSAKNCVNAPLPPANIIGIDSVFKAANPEENYYGYSKIEAEGGIITSGCKYIILRTSWLYSWFGNNFVKTMFNKIMNGEDIKVVCDQVGSPTSAHELARFIYHIIEKHGPETRYLCKEGIYNFVENGVASWYDVVECIRICLNERFCDIDAGKIKPCLSSEFEQTVTRPNYSVLDNSKTITTFGYEINYWRDSLWHVVSHLFEELFDETNKLSGKIMAAIDNVKNELDKLNKE